jgi:hypothetical protein
VQSEATVLPALRQGLPRGHTAPCLRLARANKGALGVDGIDFAVIEASGLENWLDGIETEIRRRQTESPIGSAAQTNSAAQSSVRKCLGTSRRSFRGEPIRTLFGSVVNFADLPESARRRSREAGVRGKATPNSPPTAQYRRNRPETR